MTKATLDSRYTVPLPYAGCISTDFSSTVFIYSIIYTPPPKTGNRVICVTTIGCSKSFHCLISCQIPDLHLTGDSQCFPFHIYDEHAKKKDEAITDWALGQFRERYGNKNISKWDIFNYVYGVLHHPGYRQKYADCLKRELPRIPFAPDFHAFSSAGEKLADLHINYEKQPQHKLEFIENKSTPLSYRVIDKMRLSKDKTMLIVNPSLTLSGIPAEAFEYRLGNRSALEWVIDQYQVTEDKRSGIKSDPNRPDDEEYIVHLVGQVIHVSLETVKIVKSLPAKFET